mmetsp:Transcript_32041/g.32307  ORF Transcript_32041/g.32307 Transcript_32041/m.32307 type:complete len:95 (+) Transcript_32041:149-433(+)
MEKVVLTVNLDTMTTNDFVALLPKNWYLTSKEKFIRANVTEILDSMDGDEDEEDEQEESEEEEEYGRFVNSHILEKLDKSKYIDTQMLEEIFKT